MSAAKIYKTQSFSRRIAVFSANLSNLQGKWRVIWTMCIITWRKKRKKRPGAFCPRSWGLNIHFQKRYWEKVRLFQKIKRRRATGKGGKCDRSIPLSHHNILSRSRRLLLAQSNNISINLCIIGWPTTKNIAPATSTTITYSANPSRNQSINVPPI